MRSGQERHSHVKVAPGLYALRYVDSASARNESPLIFVSVPPEFAHDIELIAGPTQTTDLLSHPGSCLVVKAGRRGEIKLTARTRNDSGSLDARVRLERLGEDFPAAEIIARPVVAAAAAAATNLQVRGHLAHFGDVEVNGGQWIGGPDMPLPVEGFSVGDFPALEYQAFFGAPRAQWTEWVQRGKFVGSKGRAMPLFGFRMRLTGEAPPYVQLKVDALFLTRPIVSKRGREIEIISSNTREPLVGFAIELEQQSRDKSNSPVLPSSIPVKPIARSTQNGRVRVFRSAQVVHH